MLFAGVSGAHVAREPRRADVASNQPHTKRDVGGQDDKAKGSGGGGGNANPPKDQPAKTSQSGGSKGKNDSGGNK